MADNTFKLIEYYPAAGIKTCPFCEVENPAGNSNCYICNTDLSIPYISPDEPAPKEKTKAPAPSKTGLRFEKPDETVAPTPEKADDSWKKILGFVVGFALIVFAIALGAQ